ncbi:MAG TPA: AMP-binding protein [Stellaceae bacterium]|nr:AMP-binding protein [Stellaceae bacterium]
MSDDTLPKLLRRNAGRIGDRPAIREKDLGIWQPYSWRRYWEEVRDFALGLAANGFKAGDKLSVIGENRPRLYFAQLAAQSLGGIAVPVYQDAIASELAYVLSHAEISVVVAEDQEQVDKILSLEAELPHLKLVVYDDSRGLNHYAHAHLKAFPAVQDEGRQFGAAHPNYVEDIVEAATAGDLALFSYTSGTTSRPKGVMLTHANLVLSAQAFADAEGFKQSEEHLAYLPMAWIGSSLISLALHILVGFTCNFPEKPETVERDLRELGPSMGLAPPRFWENSLTTILVRASDASWVKRKVFDYFRGVAERAQEHVGAGRAVPVGLRLMRGLGEVLIYGPVRDQLGWRRARLVYTGGAPLGADVFRFFRAFGVNLKQVYGATELSGLCSVQKNEAVDPDTVGHVLPGMEAQIGDGGEVLVRSPGVFRGYYKQADASAEALTADGWLKTGDAGFIDQRGHLVIIDRARDVGKLADGTSFAPQFIENKLKFSSYIGEAVVFGTDQDFVSAIVAIDPTTVGKWAERNRLAYTSFQDLSSRAEVRDMVGDEIRRCNAALPAATRIRRFVVLNKEFDADDDEITRTRKIRRRFVAEKYAPVIDAMYGGGAEVEMAAEITYEDGRKAMLQSRLAVADIDAPAERLKAAAASRARTAAAE